MINVIAGLLTTFVIVAVLYIAPKLIEMLGLPPASSDVFKLSIGAVPWLFTKIRGWLIDNKFLSFSRPQLNPVSKPSYKWSMYTAGKFFALYEFVSLITAVGGAAVVEMAKSQVEDFDIDAIKVLHFFIVIPIIFIFGIRYGTDIYNKCIKILPALLVFYFTSFVLSGIEAIYLATDGPRTVFKIEKWQLLMHVFLIPLLQGVALYFGWICSFARKIIDEMIRNLRKSPSTA